MDLTALTGAYAAVQFMRDSMSVALNAKIDEQARSKINEAMDQISKLQDGLFHTQQELLQLQQANENLRKQIAESSAWNERAKQYSLVKTNGSALVYEYSGQPHHFACPNCFESQRISALQDDRTIRGSFSCKTCDKQFLVEPVRGRGHR